MNGIDWITQEIEKSRDLKLAVVELIEAKRRKYKGDKIFTLSDGMIQRRGWNHRPFEMRDREDEQNIKNINGEKNKG